jgi:hypothetical protein
MDPCYSNPPPPYGAAEGFPPPSAPPAPADGIQRDPPPRPQRERSSCWPTVRTVATVAFVAAAIFSSIVYVMTGNPIAFGCAAASGLIAVILILCDGDETPAPAERRTHTVYTNTVYVPTSPLVQSTPVLVLPPRTPQVSYFNPLPLGHRPPTPFPLPTPTPRTRVRIGDGGTASGGASSWLSTALGSLGSQRLPAPPPTGSGCRVSIGGGGTVWGGMAAAASAALATHPRVPIGHR